MNSGEMGNLVCSGDLNVLSAALAQIYMTHYCTQVRKSSHLLSVQLRQANTLRKQQILEGDDK